MTDTLTFWDSIRWRAAFLTSALVAVVLAAFIWYTFARVRGDLIAAGAERAQTAATALAVQTGQTTQQGLTRINEISRDAVFRNYLSAPTAESERAATAALHAAGAATQDETIALWDTTGRLRLELTFPPGAETVWPQAAAPTAAGLMPLQTYGAILFTRTVAEVPGEPLGGDATPVGYLVISRVVRSSNSSALLKEIVGNGATVLIANQSGSAWSDLQRLVPAPTIDLTGRGGREFRTGDGEAVIGAFTAIPNTPWVLVVEFPRQVIVAPAWQMLRRLAVAGAAFMMLSMLAAGAISQRVTQPLGELTRAAQAIERGDYSRRVIALRRDEVGALGHAFNAMAEQVESGRASLEVRAAELAASREAAREANQAKDDFLAVLSHELRTPLSAMLGWCQMLRDGSLPPDRQDHALQVIERNALVQLRLVNDLLDISRIVAGKFTVELQATDAMTVVRAAIESAQPSASQKGIALSLELDQSASAIDVLADPGRLQQAVGNLLSNAIKFTPRGGSVWVSAAPRDGSVHIVVRDSGEGIAAEALPRIFDRLRQGESGTRRRHAGLGLGLAIVRQIVGFHEGTVAAESAGVGQGSTFRIQLPMADALAGRQDVSAASRPPGAPRAVAPAEGEPSIQGLRVLLVEDSDDARELVSSMLVAQGAIVAAAPRAATAMQWLDAHAVDIIVSDIEMPERDGLDMMRAIRSRDAGSGGQIPAIALTAYAGANDRDRSHACGFQAHLTKPVDLRDLVRTIATLVSTPPRCVSPPRGTT